MFSRVMITATLFFFVYSKQTTRDEEKCTVSCVAEGYSVGLKALQLFHHLPTINNVVFCQKSEQF